VSYTQDFFTSRNSQSAEEKIGQEGRLWYDPITNSIRVGDGKTVGGIFVGTGTPYQLPVASASTLGGVKVDGTTIVVDPITGEISSTTGDAYILRPASANTLGGVKIGDNLTIDSDGVLSAGSYSLPIASGGSVGGVKIDNSTITITEDGIISAQQYTLPIANNNELGGVKTGAGLVIDSEGKLSAIPYVLPIAGSNTLGGVKVDGTTIAISVDGVISYTLPTSTTSRLGGVIIGDGLNIDDSGILSTKNNWVMSLSAGPGISLSSSTGAVTVSSRVATMSVLGSVTVDNSTIVVNQTGRISVTTDGIVGTVKSVSVNSSNGFTGEVSSASTYPSITIGTYINGITKGVNGGLQTAEPNIDYQLPVSLTTNDVTGSATFTNNVLNIPVYQGVVTLQTVGTSGAATFDNNVLNIPQYGSVNSVTITSTDLTVGGTNPITRSGTITLSLNTVPISKGGTGRTSFDSGFVVSDGNALSTIAAISGASITGDISGKSSGLTQVLSPQFGGTGYDNLSSTITAMLPDQTGNENKVLTTDGGGILSWVEPLATSVKSVNVNGGTTGLTTTGGPVTGANGGIGIITLGGVLSVNNGGTGSTNAAEARESLKAAKSGDNSDITSLSGLTTPLSVAQGGTNASTPALARIELEVAKSGVNNDITRLSALTTPLTIAQGGTNASTPSVARTNLGAAKSGDNSDITSLSGLTTPLSVDQGGTGSKTPTGARANLGAAKSGDNSDITSLSGLTTPLSVNQGGTGSKTPEGARANLEVAKSGDNSDITSLSGLTTPLSVNQGGTGLSTLIGPNRALFSTSALTLMADVLPVLAGGTGGTTADSARINLVAAKSGANSDITSLSGLTTPLSIEQGGTGTSDPSAAINSFLPPQAGKKDFVLTTNGTNIRWDTAKPGAVGLNGQLQYNNEGFLGGTSRISYDGRGELTVGSGLSELFLIVGQEAKSITNGGSSVEIKGGDSFAIEGLTIPPAGNLYLTGGRGFGLADSGFISFSTGEPSEEVFRINSSGSWAFNKIETDTGEQNHILISRGTSQSPKWDSMIASYSKRGMVLIHPPVGDVQYGGLQLVGHPAGLGISLRAKVAEIDHDTLRDPEGRGMIKVNTINVGNQIIPDQSGKNFHFLTTDGFGVSTEEGTKSGTLRWEELPLATYGAASRPGVIKINQEHLLLDIHGQLGFNNEFFGDLFYNEFFPNQEGNQGKVLSTTGGSLFWAEMEAFIPRAGVGSEGKLGGVRLDGETIITETEGIIKVDIGGIFPVGNTTSGHGEYLTYNYNSGKIQLGWAPVQASGLEIATTNRLGVVKPDGTTIQVAHDGTLSTDIRNLLPPHPNDGNSYYLQYRYVPYEETTPELWNGYDLFWESAPVPIANYIQPGIVALNSNSMYIDPATDQISARALSLDTLEQEDYNSFIYADGGARKTQYARTVKYIHNGYEPSLDPRIYVPNSALVLGDRFRNTDSVTHEFGITSESWTNLRIYTSNSGSRPGYGYHTGTISIVGGHASGRERPTWEPEDIGIGSIFIKAGDGVAGAPSPGGFSPSSPGADIYIEAGEGYISSELDPNNNPYKQEGGQIIFKTAKYEDAKRVFTIWNTGAWQLGEMGQDSEGGGDPKIGLPGQPLLSAGGDTTPYWGTLSIEYGGTAATNKVDALTNLLPDQELAENYVLASNGTNAFWASLSGDSLVPTATEGRLGLVKPDGITTRTDDNGVISVITGGVVGTVNSVEMSGGTTGLTTLGGPITDRGTFTLGGTLKIEHGGTGATTAEAGIKKLLPTQDSSTAGKSLVSDGSTAEWIYPTTVISRGVNKNLLFNKDGVIDGITDINYVAQSALRLGSAWSDEDDNNFFTIFGASNVDGTSITQTSVNVPGPVSLVLQSGASNLSNRFGADIFLKAGSASGEESTGGNVYIDGGTSALGSGGNIIFRTAKDPASPLIEIVEIDNSGKIGINGEYGTEGMVLTSGGADTPALWKFPSVNLGGLVGSTLPSTITHSSLQQVGKLERLNVEELRFLNQYNFLPHGGLRIAGNQGWIGNNSNPRASLEVIHTRLEPDDNGNEILMNNEYSVQIQPTKEATIISSIRYQKVFDDIENSIESNNATDLVIKSKSIDLQTVNYQKDEEVTFTNDNIPGFDSQLKIHSSGQWDIQGQSGTAGQVLTSSGTGAAPQWKSAGPKYQEITATAGQIVITTTVKTVAKTDDTVYIQVFINGVLQREGATKSYMVTGTKEITFNQELQASDEITIYSFV
jgi:hypothetical protein